MFWNAYKSLSILQLLFTIVPGTMAQSYAAGGPSEPRVLNLKSEWVISRVVASPLLAARCADYLLVYAPYGRAFRDFPYCASALDQVLRLVEPTQTATFFESDLRTLLRDSEVIQYIQDLHEQLSAGRLPNLWDWTLQHPSISGNKSKAIRWLGILFHNDVESTGSLYSELNEPQAQNLSILAYTIASLVSAGTLNPFPEGVTTKTASIYHFYTIAYLTQQLLEDGVDDIYAFMAPFLLNESYEWSSFYSKKAKVAWSQVRGKQSPLKNSITVHTHDIYLGYAGAAFALQKNNDHFVGLPFKEFSKSYDKNPFVTLRQAIDISLPSSPPRLK